MNTLADPVIKIKHVLPIVKLVDEALSELMENAYVHGHNMRVDAMQTLRCFIADLELRQNANTK